MLTTIQTAKRLKLTTSRVRQLILAGRLPAQKIGRDWFVKEQDLKLFKPWPKGRPKEIKMFTKEELEKKYMNPKSGTIQTLDDWVADYHNDDPELWPGIKSEKDIPSLLEEIDE